MKKVGILLLSIILTMLVIGFAYAAEPGGATVSNVADLGEFNSPVAGTVDLEAGNITSANLDTNQSTLRWVGLLGDVSGNIILGDGNNETLYTWVAAGNLVYASAVSVDWASLNDATEAEIVAIDTVLAAQASDNYTNTFTGPSESISSNIFTTINSDYANTTSNGGNDWKTYSLEDGVGTVWAGAVQSSNQAYNGTVMDYQMIIPENGVGNTAATTYNLWVELV